MGERRRLGAGIIERVKKDRARGPGTQAAHNFKQGEGAMITKRKFYGRGWGGFKKGKRILKFADIKIGRRYLIESNGNRNVITITNGDWTGLKRPIVYYTLKPKFGPDLKNGIENAFWKWEMQFGAKLWEAL